MRITLNKKIAATYPINLKHEIDSGRDRDEEREKERDRERERETDRERDTQRFSKRKEENIRSYLGKG